MAANAGNLLPWKRTTPAPKFGSPRLSWCIKNETLKSDRSDYWWWFFFESISRCGFNSARDTKRLIQIRYDLRNELVCIVPCTVSIWYIGSHFYIPIWTTRPEEERWNFNLTTSVPASLETGFRVTLLKVKTQ